MKPHTRSHHFVRKMPDWRAVAIAGPAAGVIFLLLEVSGRG